MKRGAKAVLGTIVVLSIGGITLQAWLRKPPASFAWPSRLPSGYVLVAYVPTASRLQLQADGGIQEQEEWTFRGKGPARSAAKGLARRLGSGWSVSKGADGVRVGTDVPDAPELFLRDLPNGGHEILAKGPAVYPGEFERRLAPSLERMGLLRSRFAP